MAEAGFWSDPARARRVSEEFDSLKKEIHGWEKLRSEIEELLSVTEEAQREGTHDLQKELESLFRRLQRTFGKLEVQLLLRGPYDDRSAIVAIHAGTGGTDAQDWAAMLLRMYIRFAERKGWMVRIVDQAMGQEAGIKRATFEVVGRSAYGLLRTEAGVHRLVRISPFDAEKMRHTSFALVEVLPDLGEVGDLAIDEKDLRIDTFMSGGHGGQSVNTTYSAVRIVHVPTGITVSCQNERSQKQNKETALKILRAKLHKLQLEEREAEKRKLRGAYQSAEWGNQIRSYVLQPYRQVKDHRTKREVQDVDTVLDGDLDGFIDTALRQQTA